MKMVYEIISQEDAKSYRFFFRALAGLMIASTVIQGCGSMVSKYALGLTKKYVPRTESVAEHSVVPSKLEIRCLEGPLAKTCTTIAEYDGKRLLLQYDGTKITGVPYEVTPAGQK